MGRRAKCPHDSDKAPIINAADDHSNVPTGGRKTFLAGASGTMPFSAFVSALENFMCLQPTVWKVETVRAGQAYRATLFLFYHL